MFCAPPAAHRMRLTDIFRRLVSHFIPSRSKPETIEAKHHQSSPSHQSPTSLRSAAPKLPTTPTVTAISSTMPGLTSTAPSGISKYDQIPGPLGLASASLAGKVALVTGAGTFNVSRFSCQMLQPLDLDLHALGSACRTGRQFTPTHVRPAPTPTPGLRQHSS